MDYKIFVTYHKEELLEKYNLHEDEHHVVFASHHSIEGENINYLNPVYSEMVTMYYVWKNQIRHEYIGFEHYRRHLNVVRMPSDGECQIYRTLDFGDKTIYEQYSHSHNSEDLEKVLSLLDKKYGKRNKYSKYLRQEHILISNCTFLMKWEDFVSLCEFLFPLLEDYSKKCGMTDLGSVEDWHEKAVCEFGENAAVYQRRVVSFLAERLISAWIWNNLKFNNGIEIAIVHYNTPDITDAAIHSINKSNPGCHITLFDNSDKLPFKNVFKNVDVIDNTKGKVINFDKELKKYPRRVVDSRNPNAFGSAKHCMSVDKLMDYLPDGFILMDSDILLFGSLYDFADYSQAVCGVEYIKEGVFLFVPFICFINVPMLNEYGIRYFNGEKMWALTDIYPNTRYDTGAWLYEEVTRIGLPWKQLNIWKYIVHFGHASWKDNDYVEWLEQYKHLWK